MLLKIATPLGKVHVQYIHACTAEETTVQREKGGDDVMMMYVINLKKLP